MQLSVVTTLYKSENYIDEFYNRTLKVLRKLKFDDYEILFVNDGSPDNSEQKVFELIKHDKKVKYIELSRNFGHHNAISAGLDNCKGDLVYLLDVDLEEQPEWLEEFYKNLVTRKLDVIYGVQKKRSGNLFRKFTGNIWYTILNKFSNIKHDNNLVTARLMTREYIDSLVHFKEKATIISGIFALAGFKQDKIFVDKRFKGKSTYSLSNKIDIVFKSLVSLTDKPLRLIIFINLFFSFLSFAYSLNTIINKIQADEFIPGWASLSLLVSGSFILVSLTLVILGLYLEQIYNEVKNRPKYIIRKKII